MLLCFYFFLGQGPRVSDLAMLFIRKGQTNGFNLATLSNPVISPTLPPGPAGLVEALSCLMREFNMTMASAGRAGSAGWHQVLDRDSVAAARGPGQWPSREILNRDSVAWRLRLRCVLRT